MGGTYLKIMSRYTIALIFAMFLKILIVDMVFAEDAKEYIFLPSEPFVLKYEEVDIIKDGITIKKPIFNNNAINNQIDNYLNYHSCTSLEYNIFEINNESASIFLNCGAPKNIIYNYIQKKSMTFDELSNDFESFRVNEIRLLKLKYPAFVVEDVSFKDAVYDIYENEIIGHYDTTYYGSLTIKLNNHEIKELMKYDMHYDDAYENEVYMLDPNKPTISFTFDDGPSNYDIELARLLVDAHASAGFFIVGNRVGNFEDVVKTLVSSNMEIGNHTYSHKVMTSLSNTAITEQLTKTNDIFYNLTGQKMTLFRPPYGSVNKRVLLQSGMSSIMWNVDTLDWKTRDADKVYEAIMKDIKDGDIVLMHSLYPTTVEAVKRSLPELYKRGYQVVSVSKLAELKGKTLSTGSTYNKLQ